MPLRYVYTIHAYPKTSLLKKYFFGIVKKLDIILSAYCCTIAKFFLAVLVHQYFNFLN